jgi:hypothetical protein
MRKPFMTPARAAATACIVILSGCDGASQASSLPQSTWESFSMQRIGAAHQAAWMAPGTAGETLLYVSDAGAASVYVYSYPQAKLVGTLTGFSEPGGECTDKAGDVWIADSESLQLSEYAHGGTTPIATLGPNLDFAPLGCAVNPVTGDLAVANVCGGRNCAGNGSLAIYLKAQGTPTNYLDPAIAQYFFCAYDEAGNLFVDGYTGGGDFGLAELPSGKRNLRNLTVNVPIRKPGDLHWDGKNIAIGSGSDYVFEFKIAGLKGAEVGNTPLTGQASVMQFAIDGSRVIAAADNPHYTPSVTYYRYPHGGWPQKTITGFQEPIGVVLSPGGTKNARSQRR